MWYGYFSRQSGELFAYSACYVLDVSHCGVILCDEAPDVRTWNPKTRQFGEVKCDEHPVTERA